MSRNGFDDIFRARGLKESIYTPDMEDVVPKDGGILGRFDYRRPYENENPGFGVLSQIDTSFDTPHIPAGDDWLASAQKRNAARANGDQFFGGLTPLSSDELNAAAQRMGKPEIIRPDPIPKSFFEGDPPTFFDRADRYIEEARDATRRGLFNTLGPDLGNYATAGFQTVFGNDGESFDFGENLRRQRIKSKLAEINSPIATGFGEFLGSVVGGGLGARGWNPSVQGVVRKYFLKK